MTAKALTSTRRTAHKRRIPTKAKFLAMFQSLSAEQQLQVVSELACGWLRRKLAEGRASFLKDFQRLMVTHRKEGRSHA